MPIRGTVLCVADVAHLALSLTACVHRGASQALRAPNFSAEVVGRPGHGCQLESSGPAGAPFLATEQLALDNRGQAAALRVPSEAERRHGWQRTRIAHVAVSQGCCSFVTQHPALGAWRSRQQSAKAKLKGSAPANARSTSWVGVVVLAQEHSSARPSP